VLQQGIVIQSRQRPPRAAVAKTAQEPRLFRGTPIFEQGRLDLYGSYWFKVEPLAARNDRLGQTPGSLVSNMKSTFGCGSSSVLSRQLAASDDNSSASPIMKTR